MIVTCAFCGATVEYKGKKIEGINKSAMTLASESGWTFILPDGHNEIQFCPACSIMRSRGTHEVPKLRK